MDESAPIIRADNQSAAALADLCQDLDHWPHSWRIEDADILLGQRIVEFLRPFLFDLLAQRLAVKTLRRHRDHLWMLGGEIVRRRHDDPELRDKTIEYIALQIIDDDCGPLIWPRISESEQNAFDATCRKLYKFLITNSHTHRFR